MSLFSHVMIGTNDMDASKKFYDALFATLGHKPGFVDPKGRCFYFTGGGTFSLSVPIRP